MLAAWGGLRFGEIGALRTDRVDFGRRQVRDDEGADLVGFGGTELGEDQLVENAALSSARLAGRIAENL